MDYKLNEEHRAEVNALIERAQDDLEGVLYQLLGQREELRVALGRIERHGPIMGSRGDYRQGQLDILETVSTIAGLALCANKVI